MIYLKYFDRSDVKQLVNWIDSPELLLQWGGPEFNYPLDETQIEQYIKRANNDGSDRLVYKVIYKEEGNVIGHISLGKIDRKNRSARIGKVLVGDKSFRGQGISQMMVREILRVAFEQLRLHRVSLGVFDFNKPAIASYEKVGFKKEGLLRDFRKIGNEYWSAWEMSMLENEWFNKENLASAKP
ncbi:GNAT family N-acetyltransferase [Pseudalkalibacillus decolorationis]|uniref:GNAT family N-acetyltransferase n=1 Tax=Pseudalkalibacillus decolorationis TaxID=163879 RepID=UPI0021477325|nr:GNAT family protein [Pseudalkalibacillus decolorationis]